jgi:hypothetical protein
MSMNQTVWFNANISCDLNPLFIGISSLLTIDYVLITIIGELFYCVGSFCLSQTPRALYVNIVG